MPACAPDARRPGQADVLRLDGDAALALDVHAVEVLGAHLAPLDEPGDLEHPVGQRRLAVVDVGDDAEVPDEGRIGGSRCRHSAPIVPCPPTGPGDRGRSGCGRDRRTRGTAGWGPGSDAGIFAGRSCGACRPDADLQARLSEVLPPVETPRLTRGEHQVPDQAEQDQREGASAQRRGQVRPEDGRPARPHRRDAGDAEAAAAALKTASKALDKAASKGVIHKNQAANRKSGLAKQVAGL